MTPSGNIWKALFFGLFGVVITGFGAFLVSAKTNAVQDQKIEMVEEGVSENEKHIRELANETHELVVNLKELTVRIEQLVD